MSSLEATRTPDPRPSHALLRVLGVGFGLAIVVGGTVGIGILRAPGPIAAALNDPALIIAVWLLGGFYVLLGANSLAELATAIPRAGGPCVYARRAYGDYAGFVVGWGDWLNYTAAQAFLAVAFAEYAGALLPPLAGHEGAVAVATLAGFTLLHWTGVRSGSAVQQLASVLKMLALIGFVAVCLWADPAPTPVAAPAAPPAEPLRGALLLMAMVVSMQMVFETYSGWNSAVYFTEEDRNPGRNLPRALFGGALLVIGIYVLVNLAYLHVLPMEVLAASKLPAADAMHAVFGPRGAQLVTALAALSLLGILNAGLMNAPRILYALGRDGLFADRAQTVNAGGTPVIALLVCTAGAAVLAASGTFEELFLLGAFVGVLLDGSMAIALFVLRRREPGLERPYKAFGYPFAPLLYATIALAIFIGFLVHDPHGSLLGLAAIAASYPLYRLVRRRRMAASRASRAAAG
jgi:APA family basic amino acid/polyamine antiporter